MPVAITASSSCVRRGDAQALVVEEGALALLGAEEIVVGADCRRRRRRSWPRAPARSKSQSAACRAGSWWCRRADRRSSGGSCRCPRACRLPRRGSRSPAAPWRARDRRLFGALVGGGDEIGRPLQRHLQVLDLAEVAVEPAAGAPRGLDHDVEKRGVKHGGWLRADGLSSRERERSALSVRARQALRAQSIICR